MMIKKLLLSLTLLSLSASLLAQKRATVRYITFDEQTIEANPLEEYAQPSLSIEEIGKKNFIKLYPQITFQEIAGIGGCFNEIGGEALAALDEAEQQSLLTALFDKEHGSGFNFCRASIGSSDFGIDAYSFSEVAGDYQMEHFTMERERQYMLPFMQKALAINPDLKLFGSPWSPPAWMKVSGYMDRGRELPDQNTLIDDPKIYKAYALYFLKYLEAYQAAGVAVDRILIQNEQDNNAKYPSCRFPVELMSEFVSTYLKPLFVEKGIKTEIWAGTFRTAGELEALKFAASPLLQRNFEGMGIQYTSAQYIQDIVSLAPNMKLMHTESRCFNGKNSIEQAQGRFVEIAGYINGGSENFAYWNMILNESGKSGWNWRQNALVTIDRTTKSVTYNPDYAVLSLMSRSIKPNALRIAAYSSQTLITLSNGETYTIIMQNDSDKSIAYSCVIDDEQTLFEIPAKSLCAVEIK